MRLRKQEELCKTEVAARGSTRLAWRCLKGGATIHSFKPDGSDIRVETHGVRNSVGFDFHPETGKRWFADNNQDRIGEHGPNDELNRLSESGEHFGFPVCHGIGVIDPELDEAGACDGTHRHASLVCLPPVSR